MPVCYLNVFNGLKNFSHTHVNHGVIFFPIFRLKFLLQDKEEQVEDNESGCQNNRPAGRAVKHVNLGARTSEGRRMADLRNTYSV